MLQFFKKKSWIYLKWFLLNNQFSALTLQTIDSF